MKELETHLNTGINSTHKTEVTVKKKQEVEYVLVGEIKPKNGQKVFEINQETGVIKPAEYKVDTVVYHLSMTKAPTKLVVNADCIYIPAMNAENAKKKYLKDNTQSSYFAKPAIFNLNDIP